MSKKVFFCLLYFIIISVSSFAQVPGTTADPLVSKSYVDRFLKFREVVFKAGTVLPLNTGSMIVLISGKAHLEFKKGSGMIDLTGGLPLKNGKSVALNRLYIACENEGAVIKIDKEATALILGINEAVK